MEQQSANGSMWTRFNPAEASKRTGSFYFHDEELVTAINIALAIGRPLFLSGASGVGKSSVAEGVSRHLAWGLRTCTISSRLTADDLKYEFDSVRRLADAQAAKEQGSLRQELDYLRPGPLWWAFDPDSAAGQAQRYAAASGEVIESDPKADAHGRVLLIDEIDKAEPDLPNDLLDAFGARTFDVPFGGGRVTLTDTLNVLVVITSNRERDMPAAFLRRCIPHELQAPKSTEAHAIAQRYMEIKDEGVARPRKRPTDDELALIIRMMQNEANEIDAASFVDLIEAMRVTWDRAPDLTAQDMLDAFKPILDRRTADVEKAQKG